MKITIMGIPYRVRFCKTERDVDVEGKCNLSGQVSFTQRMISLHYGKEISKEELVDTLLHEIIHIIFHHLFRNDERFGDLCQHDAFVEPFATILSDTLTRNNLVSWKIPAKNKK